MSEQKFNDIHKKSGVFWVAIVSASLLVVVIVGVVLGTLAGYVSFGKNGSSIGINNDKAVCDVQVVTQYNKVLMADVSELSDGAAYQRSVIDFGKTVRDKSGYDRDATCLYISARTAIEERDYARAQADADKLLQVVQKGDYVNTLLYGVSSVQQLQNGIKGLQVKSRG